MKYGVDCQLFFRFANRNVKPEHKPITFTRANGINIDGGDGDIFQIEVVASNDTVTNATALVFEMSLQAHGNITMSKFILYPNIHQVLMEDVRLSVDNVGMEYHPYGSLLTRILQKESEYFNTLMAKGWNLANLNPMFGLASGFIKNTVLSPYIVDGWLYAGFEMYADLPTEVEGE